VKEAVIKTTKFYAIIRFILFSSMRLTDFVCSSNSCW